MAGTKDSEQTALEKIHDLSKLIQRFAARNDHKMLVKRLCLGYLRDLARLTDLLFETYGAQAITVLDELKTVETSFRTVATAKGMTTSSSDDKEEEEDSIMDSEKAKVEDLVQHGRLEFARGENLVAAIDNIRKAERTFDFQQRIWIEKKRAAMKLECSADQFTYGTTSLSAWAAITSAPSWEQSIDDLEYSSPSTFLEFVVFGSSSGLLLFYLAALYPGATCTGYEVMPSLHELSSQLAKEHSFDNVDCKLQDMMKARISSANVVVLTSLCWDNATRQGVAKKLARELPSGALVIDYRSDTFSAHGVQDEARAYYKSRLSAPKQQLKCSSSDVQTSVSSIEERDQERTNSKRTDAQIRRSSTDQLMKHLSTALFGVDHKSVCDRASRRQADDHIDLLGLGLGLGASSGDKRRSLQGSYSSGGGSGSGGEDIDGVEGVVSRFKIVGIVEGVTSWNDRQKLYIYKSSRQQPSST